MDKLPGAADRAGAPYLVVEATPTFSVLAPLCHCLTSSLGANPVQETTLVHHVFGCYMRSEVACLACGHVSKSYDPQLGLVLELHGGAYRAGSVEEALRHHTARERLDGANKYKCDK